jgi:tetratricopeptide (TPR) repeat protein
MPYSRPEELNRAEELLHKIKIEEVLEIITNFEKKNQLNPEEQLTILLLKGHIHGYNRQFKNVEEVGKSAYKMSLNLGLISETIESLILQSVIMFLGKFDEAFDLLLKAEKLFKSINKESQINLLRLKSMIFQLKSWVYWFKNNIDDALDLTFQHQPIIEELGYKDVLANNFLLQGYIYLSRAEYDLALDCTKNSLILYKRLNAHNMIVACLNSLGYIHFYKGDIKIALDYAQKSLNSNKFENRERVEALEVLGLIYREKGELHQALEYFNQVVFLADKLDIIDKLALNLQNTGITHMIMGEKDKAIEHLQRSLTFLKTIGYNAAVPQPMFNLVLIYLEKNSHVQAQEYLTKLEDYSKNFKSKGGDQLYLIAKASVLKSSIRIHDHAEAENILKQVLEKEISSQLKIYSRVLLCDLLLEELSIYNNPEVLDEINILIKRLLKAVEKEYSFSRLSEVKLLQAKLALIQMDIEGAKKLLKDAQYIAESHDLKRLSIQISNEHDKLLEQMNEWDSLKKKDAPMADRIELASLEGVFDRLQGKRAVDPPELIDEKPTLLLIIGEGGVLVFSYPFSDEWGIDEDLFSSFLSAFASFSNEFFTKGLDRAKFGDDLILMQTIDRFSICYLFKGQTYQATQRLTQFTEQVQNTAPVWKTLEKFYETSQVLELKDSPRLESIITEIFMSKNPGNIKIT